MRLSLGGKKAKDAPVERKKSPNSLHWKKQVSFLQRKEGIMGRKRKPNGGISVEEKR